MIKPKMPRKPYDRIRFDEEIPNNIPISEIVHLAEQFAEKHKIEVNEVELSCIHIDYYNDTKMELTYLESDEDFNIRLDKYKRDYQEYKKNYLKWKEKQ